MYCAYQGAANGEFWYVIYDGTSWTDGNKTAYATYGAPALAAYNGTLHVFHEGYQTASVGEGASIGGTIGGFGGSVGGAPGAAAGAAVGAVGGAIVNAINGPRSFKLWYTAAKPGYTDFTSPQDTDTGFGVTDPPSLAVSGNKLYSVHQGHGSNGEIWWFNVDGDKRSGDGKLNGSTASPPALAEFNGELYCVYQKAGTDGYMGWTKLPITSPAAAPGPNAAWVEAKGANSYLYYRLDNTATGGAAVTQTKTVTIDSGAPFLYAALIKSTESADFPSGAKLKITGPDNKTYSAAQDDDQVYALAEGGSLSTLVIKKPKAGDYKVELTVPPNVSFDFELATLPSKDVGQTIQDAPASLSSGQGNPGQVNPGKGIELQTSGGRKGKGPASGSLRRDVTGMTATIVHRLTRPRPETGEPGTSGKRTRVDDLVSAATDDALRVEDFAEASTSADVTRDIPPDRPAALPDATMELANSVPTLGPVTDAPTHRRSPQVRIATWNVFHGNFAGRSIADRMRGMLIVGARQRLGIIAFQEVPRGDATRDP